MTKDVNVHETHALKLQLIEWILQLKDEGMIQYLGTLFQENSIETDAAPQYSEELKWLNSSLSEANLGQFHPHEDVVEESKQWI